MDNDILQEPPIAGSEIDTLLGALERNRRTFAWKCGGLAAEGLSAKHPPSTVTLGGLLEHLALVEDEYFTGRLHDRDLPAPWDVERCPGGRSRKPSRPAGSTSWRSVPATAGRRACATSWST
ncbi:mycothiol transferase [Kribbella turkmenica]|uniref:mycothiol transferase n=1 Tax=Kribbella turkmenica TaxID=2530375 RepID=UPI0026B577C0